LWIINTGSIHQAGRGGGKEWGIKMRKPWPSDSFFSFVEVEAEESGQISGFIDFVE
jgi:hypothetical protein